MRYYFSMVVAADDNIHVKVRAAFLLGWRLAEIYDDPDLPTPPQEKETKLPDHLPGAREMSKHAQALAMIEQATAAWQVLAPDLGRTLITPATITDALLTPEHDNHRNHVRKAVHEFYLDMQKALASQATPVFVAYGLGRMLADTSLLLHSDDPKVLLEEFKSERLDNAYTWLDDLDAAFPERSTAAVSASLRRWQAWVKAFESKHGRSLPPSLDVLVTRRLREQGELWRRLLSGDKAPEALLKSKDYIRAAARLLRRMRGIGMRFLWHWGWLVLILVVGIPYLALRIVPGGSSRTITLLVSAATSLGLTWRGIAATLGKILTRAESYLWDTEVTAAIGEAATVRPPTAYEKVARNVTQGFRGLVRLTPVDAGQP